MDNLDVNWNAYWRETIKILKEKIEKMEDKKKIAKLEGIIHYIKNIMMKNI